MRKRRRVLLMFSASESRTRMLAKGNVWYVRHYERWFDRIYFVYLQGGGGKPVRHGKVVLIAVGGARKVCDLVFSPFRLYAIAKRIPTPHLLTADVLYSWWSTAVARMLLRFSYVLMPVCIPQQLWKLQGSPVQLLKHGLRRLACRMSFWSARRVWTGEAFGGYVHWLKSYPPARQKLFVTGALVEALPTVDFFRALDAQNADFNAPCSTFNLIYVGRLEPEKQVSDLLLLMERLSVIEEDGAPYVTLHLVGDGTLRHDLETRSNKAEFGDRVVFHGTKANGEIPALLQKAHVFVSTLTGSSLREAALCGLAVVAYDRDWVSGLLRNEETALLVPPGDVNAMAEAVLRLHKQDHLRKVLGENIRALALKMWSPSALDASAGAVRLVFPEPESRGA